MAKSPKAGPGKPAKAGPGKTKRSIDWERIRAEYEVGGPENSVRSIAGRHSVSHTAVQKRIKAENWPDPGDLDEVIRRKVATKVASVVATDNPKKKGEALDAEVERRAAVVQRHRLEWEEIEQLRLEALQAREGEPVIVDGVVVESETAAAFGKAKLLKIMAEATAIKQAAQRKAWALDAKGGGGDAPPGQVTTFRIAPLE